MAHFSIRVNPVCALCEAITAQTVEVWAVLRHCVPNKRTASSCGSLSLSPARLSFENGFGKPFSNGKPENA